MQDFLDREAEFDGAEIDEIPSPSSREDGPVVADEQAIWQEMDKILHFRDRDSGALASNGSEGSSFYGEYSDDDEISPLGGMHFSDQVLHEAKAGWPGLHDVIQAKFTLNIQLFKPA